MSRSQEVSTPGSSLVLYTALATVFCSSFAIMLLQLVAGRLVAAYVGQSLYTWTSAIGVTLAGIAIGNAFGGRIADRAGGTRTLALQMLAAAAAVLSVLALNPLAGNLPPLIALPWPGRIFLHMTIVFLLPYIVLGTISPVISKLVLDTGGPAGRRIGSVYACSISGSLVGVFVTGYFLLAWAGNRSILICSAIVLALLGLALFARGRNAPGATETAVRTHHRVGWKPILAMALAGAFVMMVELTAARMLSRVYGSSLFNWTTTIGVILAAMAAGGHFGGRWADRFGGLRALTGALVGASAAVAACSVLHMVCYHTPLLWDLSWPMQILVHTILVFFLPCFLLGAAPPAIVRLTLEECPEAGHAVGTLYAWNSIGSVVGAFLTGFVLIATVGTVNVLCITFLSVAALALAFAPRSYAARLWSGVAIFLGMTAYAPIATFEVLGLNLALRTYHPADLVYENESQYSYIAVKENDPENNPNLRTFVLDKLVHSKADISKPLEFKYPYLQFYASALDAAYPPGGPLHTLTLGGGGYNFITYLELARPNGKTEVAEIDPKVTEAAHEAFGFPKDTKAIVHHMDGRNLVEEYLRNGPTYGQFDAIFGDCVSDYSVPFHLTTLEFTQGIGKLLKDDGIYMLEMIDMYDVGDFLAAAIGTCRQVFPYIQVYCPDGRLDTRETFVIVASKRELDLSSASNAVNAKTHGTGRLLTAEELGALSKRAKVQVLTDDYAPVENLLASVVLKTEDTTLLRRLARADGFMLRDRPEDAAREAEKIVSVSDHFPEASLLLANAYGRLGKDADAVKVLQDLVKAHPQNAEYHDRLAVHLFRAGQVQQAVDEWNTAFKEQPEFGPAHVNMGAAMTQLKRYDEAEVHFQQAARLMPKSLDPVIGLGAMYDARGDAASATKVLHEAALAHPNDAMLQQQLAIAAYKAKDYNTAWEAVKVLRQMAAGVDPGLLHDLQRDSGRAE